MNQQASLSDQELESRLAKYVGRRYGKVYAWDRVNKPMIRQWAEAFGYKYPLLDPDTATASRFGDLVAPATMLHVWLMPGLDYLRPEGSDESNPREHFTLLEEAGYYGIIATNCEQEYMRPLKVGELLSMTTKVESISNRKITRLGPGYFTIFLHEYFNEEDELVGTQRISILRYRPEGGSTDKPAPPQPGISPDTQFFWDGLKEEKLLIQKCSGCGALRHPPGPACTECHSLDWEAVQASGKGTVFSFVIMHHPKYDAFDYPHPVGLIELEEGVRIVAPMAGVDPDKIEIGMPVEVEFDNIEGQHRLPNFRPA